MFTLIEHGELYTPEPLGIQSLLLANGRIAKIGHISSALLKNVGLDCEVIDATGCIVTPGFIDPHAHLIGAGGEQGFDSRVPEIPLSQLTSAGITTVVGVIGTDTTTRSLAALLAKARELELGGISTFMYTGGFHVPPVTLTGDVNRDLILIDKIIGVGEIAISDVRSVEPTLNELAALISQALTGGMVAGKAGVTHFHVGPGNRYLQLLHQLLDSYDIPPDAIYPTHVTRSRELMDDAIRLSQRGAYVDTDTIEEDTGKWLRYYLKNGGVANRFTISSDAHTVDGRTAKLYTQFVSCIHDHGLSLTQTLPHFTSNTAAALKLEMKGRLHTGADADVLLLDKDTLDIEHVFARGQHMVKQGRVVVHGKYESYALSAEEAVKQEKIT